MEEKLDQILRKLEEHDRRFERLEERSARLEAAQHAMQADVDLIRGYCLQLVTRLLSPHEQRVVTGSSSPSTPALPLAAKPHDP